MRHEMEESEVKGFDMRVTHRDPRTGQITRRDPYIMRTVKKDGGGSAQYFERPSGSGNLFDGQGNPCGRWDATKKEGERYDAKASHIAWERPKTEDEKLANALIAADAKNKALEAELAAVKAESAKKSAPAAGKSTKES
jgi:hypothetical protein